MGHSVPPSRILFTDLMFLLVSVLMGLISVMSFSEDRQEKLLPPVELPDAPASENGGWSAAKPTYITILSGEKGATYFFNEREVTLRELVELIKHANITTVVLRGERRASFEWEEYCQLTFDLMKAGVKRISFATTTTGGVKPC